MAEHDWAKASHAVVQVMIRRRPSHSLAMDRQLQGHGWAIVLARPDMAPTNDGSWRQR